MRTFSLVSICGSGAKRWTSLSTKRNRRMKCRSETHKRARRQYETERAAVVIDGGALGRGGLKGGGKGTGWRADGTSGGLVRVGFASKNARLKLLDRDIGANTQIPGRACGHVSGPIPWGSQHELLVRYMGFLSKVIIEMSCGGHISHSDWPACVGDTGLRNGGEDIRFVQKTVKQFPYLENMSLGCAVLEVVRGGVIVAYHSWGDREEWIRKAKKRTKSEERKVFQPFLYNVRRTVQVEME
ncbi:hypothetical protein B0H14DRAFT_2560701 [Mycena olivaceomarginata]|nr:hypothetical protein B0H14DRAFT_2560701 [Mycena olivaceomarginata]